jgi:hypothetical protein
MAGSALVWATAAERCGSSASMKTGLWGGKVYREQVIRAD